MAELGLINLLRDALIGIESASRETQQALEEERLSLKDQVELGQILWRVINRAQEALEPLKDSLREEGQERQGVTPGRQFLSGRSRNSRCTVTIPPPSIKLRSDVDIGALRKALGHDFEAFFNVVVTPRREFADRAAERPDLLQELTKAVDTVTDKPRVSFND
jgi:hypothetical protein